MNVHLHDPVADAPEGTVARALRVIAGKDADTQLALLNEYVEQGERDRIPEDELNALRRLYIRHASEIYRTRHYG